jgi:MoaA/NifB/PqqE/SkfB family radical SAM enzyme
MKRFVRSLSWRVYHAVHTSGLLADAVYAGAYRFNQFRRRFQFKKLTKNHVTYEELFQHRHVEPTATLMTGVTNICNAKCVFCAYPKVVANKTLQTGVMPFETFKKAVDEWAALGGQNIDLTPVVGDPLVDPGVLDKIRYAIQKAGVKNVYLTTNAILINRNDTYKKLIDLGVAGIFISTQGTDKAMYEKVYGVEKFEDMISGVRNLMRYNKEKGEPTHIVVRFRNAEKPSQIVRSQVFKEYIKPYLSEKVRVNFTVDFDNWGGTILAEELPGNMKMRKLPERLDVPCKGLFGFSMRHDGNVRLCGCRLTKTDMDDLVVGNIKEHTLQEISQSEKAWKIIKGFYSGVRPETCVGCTMYQPIDQKWLQHRAKSGDATPKSNQPAPAETAFSNA